MYALKSKLASAIVAGVTAAINSPTTSAQPSDKVEISNTVIKATEGIVINATNSEPWYQSRVTVGNYVAIAAQVLGPVIGRSFPPDEQALVTVAIMGIGAVVGAGFSLYGRWFPNKPLGS